MATPDVRVRLSAEGVAEVVAALKKVQAESDKAAAKQSQGFLKLNSVLGSTQRLLAGVGIALGVREFVGFIRQSADAADQLGELGQSVGASVEHLSALSTVARKNNVELTQLTQALAQMNRRIGELAEGSPAAATTFRDLGLTLDDLKGKDAVERLELISKKLAQIPPGATKTRVAMDLFGRSGAQLIPTMNELAEVGLTGVIDRARELGQLIDTDMARAADKFNDDLDDMKLRAQALGIQFVTGLAPSVSQSLQIMSGDLEDSSTSWRTFGDAVGKVMKFVVGVVTSAFDLVGVGLAEALIAVDGTARALIALTKGRLNEAKEAFRVAGRSIAEETGKLEERLRNRFEAVFHGPTEPVGPRPADARGTVPEEPGPDPAEAIRRRAEAARALLDQELRLVQLQARLRTEADRRAFDEGLIDVREYYRRRREIATAEANKEIAALEQKRVLLADETDPGKRAQETGKIDAALQAARLDRENQLATLTFEELRAVRDLGRERLQIEQKVLEAQGRTHEAALLAIEEELRQAEELFQKQGLADEERVRQVERLRAALTGAVEFEEAERRAQGALDDLARGRAAIQAQVEAGVLSQLQGEERILAIERERLVALEGLAQGLEAAARATGNPEHIAQALAFSDAVRDLSVSLAGAQTSLAAFGQTALDASRTALTEFFDTGISGAKSFRDAFRDMVLSIIADLRRMAAQLIATAILRKIAGAFGGGGQVGGEGGEKKATGGLLGGVGTPTSDSNLAWFSRGEYLVRAAVVREPGVLRHLEQLNTRGARALVPSPAPIPRFAEGGLVGGAAGQGAQDGRLLIGLEEGLILRQLETSAGQRILVRAVAKNRRAIRSSLGL